MDKIFIRNLKTIGILGIHPHEQKTPRDIIISVDLSTDITRAAANDDILATVNYATLAKAIQEFINTHAFLTIEALAETLAGEILRNPLIRKIKLRVEKPGAVPAAETVGVEITRHRSD
jgi:dihydroneopterin aldolase